jgi:hypothetical protein
MARRFLLAAVVAVAAAVCPASSFAATAPATAPTVAAQYALPVVLTWVPSTDAANTQQTVYRADGACPASGAAPVGAPVSSASALPANATTGTDSTTPADGVYCYHVMADDAVTALVPGTGARGPGITVAVDVTSPVAAPVVVSGLKGGVASGFLTVSTQGNTDAGSGVATTDVRVGAVGGCLGGTVIVSAGGGSVTGGWDTTRFANGQYDICSVVTDNAGHVDVDAAHVTVTNASPVVAPVVAPPADSSGSVTAPATPAVAGNDPADQIATKAPTGVTIILPRVRAISGTVAVRLRWVNPTASDLARVVVVLNPKRPPSNPNDGTRVYRGSGTTATLKLKAGSTGYVALFAYDNSGNVSTPARKIVSLAPLIPLRPTTGSSVTTAPRLTWTAQKGTAYYNVQLFHNGTRVLTGWPTQAAFSLPAAKLKSGTYVWFVWPAITHSGAAATFGKLIGRATFLYKAG